MNSHLTLYLATAHTDELVRQAKAAKSLGGNERDAGEHSHPRGAPVAENPE